VVTFSKFAQVVLAGQGRASVVSKAKMVKLRANVGGQIKRAGAGTRLRVEQVEVIEVGKVAEQLAGQAVERGRDRQRQPPAPVARPVDECGVLQRLVIIEPLLYRTIVLVVQLQLNRLKRLHILKRQDARFSTTTNTITASSPVI